MTIDLSETCRICIQPTKKLFSQLNDEINDMLTEVLPIQLPDDNRLPQKICFTCKRRVNKFCTFRRTFVKNDHKLRELLNEECAAVNDLPLKCELDDKLHIKNEDEDDEWKNDKEKNEPLAKIKQRLQITSQKKAMKLINTNAKPSVTFDGKTHTCLTCRTSFVEFVTFQTHMKREHNVETVLDRFPNLKDVSGMYRCGKVGCKRVKATLYQLGCHMSKDHGVQYQRDYTCFICTRKYYLKEHVDLHVIGIHLKGVDVNELTDDTGFTCLKCDSPSTFKELADLAKHCRRAHKYTNFQMRKVFCQELISKIRGTQCSLCKRYVLNITSHVNRTHTDQLSATQCSTCLQKFETLVELKRHKGSVHRLKKICAYCGVEYRGSKHLLKHKPERAERVGKMRERKRRSDGDRKFPCHLCDLICKCSSTLKVHIRKVHESGFTKCTICEKVVKTVYMKNHVDRAHANVKEYPCDVCKRILRTSDALKHHMRIHTDERPFACEFCPEAFRTARLRKHHQMRHTGERPHKCHVCHKGFIQRSPWLTHMKTHGNLPRFTCVICQVVFFQAHDLTEHLTKFHPTFAKHERFDGV